VNRAHPRIVTTINEMLGNLLRVSVRSKSQTSESGLTSLLFVPKAIATTLWNLPSKKRKCVSTRRNLSRRLIAWWLFQLAPIIPRSTDILFPEECFERARNKDRSALMAPVTVAGVEFSPMARRRLSFVAAVRRPVRSHVGGSEFLVSMKDPEQHFVCVGPRRRNLGG
jgi:hypothetical protein